MQKQHQLNRLRKRLRASVGRAILDFGMIEDGDKVMVCLSGGKDSYTLLDILLCLQRSAPVSFSLVAVNLDQKQPGFPEDILPRYLDDLGVAYHILEQDTYAVVKDRTPEGKIYCPLCSRLRRGILYSFAKQIGAHKVALGHHREDLIETLFLNMFYGGRLKTMPPKLLADDKGNIVIRPLVYCREKDIVEFAELAEFPIIPCNLCGSQENLQRQKIKAMLAEWDREHPGRIESIFRSLGSVIPSHLLDTDLQDFGALSSEVLQRPEIPAGHEESADKRRRTMPLLDLTEEAQRKALR